MILYYSACGNSSFVAREFAAQLDETLYYIPEMQISGRYDFNCDGKSLGFVFPVYGWDVPCNVADYIRKLNIVGKPSYVWFACTCGDNIGETGERMRKMLEKKGLKLDASFTFLMPETYLCFPGFKLDSPEGETAKLDGVKAKLPKVAEDIRQQRVVEDLLAGSWPRFKTYVVGTLFKLFVSDRKFHSTSDCVGCGICAKKCPFGNIKMIQKDGSARPKWQHNCTQCMACYHFCPHNAVHYGRLTIGKGQYHL